MKLKNNIGKVTPLPFEESKQNGPPIASPRPKKVLREIPSKKGTRPECLINHTEVKTYKIAENPAVNQSLAPKKCAKIIRFSAKISF
jgi:hypothetical protein